MPLDSNIPDDSPNDQPGDDLQSRFDATQARLETITSEITEFTAKREREDHAAAVRRKLHPMLGKLGFEPSDFASCEQSAGGLHSFAIDAETGELMTTLGGVPYRARDVLEDHIGLRGLLKNISSSRSDDSKLQREKAELEKRHEDLFAFGRQNRGLAPGQDHEFQQIVNRLHEIDRIEKQQAAARKPVGIVDRGLIQRRKALIAEREQVQAEFRKSRGMRNDLFVKADKLTQQINAISRDILSQEGGE